MPEDVKQVLAWLERQGTQAHRDGMARFAIPSDKAFGVPLGILRQHAKRLGPSHELAAALWDSGWYEARLLACFVDEPARVTTAQMDRWCRDFDNWAICDTACFALFDRTPHAWGRLAPWSRRSGEFAKRAAFALLWALSVHDKKADDALFLQGLALVEKHAGDDRHFVKKAINMALRAVGKRNAALHAAAVAVAQRLGGSDGTCERWVGRDALKELGGPVVARRLAAKARREA